MASYQLAYSRGFRFIVIHWFTLIAVPVTLLAMLIAGDFYFQNSVEWLQPLSNTVNSYLIPMGIYLTIGQAPNLGGELLHHLLHIMFFTVGWHYAKQVFGCFMVFSHFNGYQVSANQRTLIKASLLFIWGYAFMSANESLKGSSYHTLPYITHDFPNWMVDFFSIGTIILYAAVAYQVFYLNWKNTGQLPPASAVVAWAALFIWFMPYGEITLYHALAVPFFHSLQYLPFVAKVQAAKHQSTEGVEWNRSVNLRLMLNFSLLVAAGWIMFEVSGNLLDDFRNSDQLLYSGYWLVGIAVIINIHHYFIDHVIWRMSDPVVRNRLTA